MLYLRYSAFLLFFANSWCDTAATERKCLPERGAYLAQNAYEAVNQSGHTHPWKVIQGQPDSFLNYVDKVTKCHESHRQHMRRILIHTTDEVIENLSRAGETKGMNIWPCHLDAARSPADRVSKRCSCGALWVLCRLGWRVMLQDTWPHAAGGESSDEGQDGPGWASGRLCGDWAVWCSARRRYVWEWYNLSSDCVFVCLHVDSASVWR